LVSEQGRGTLTRRVVGKGVGGFRIGIGGQAGALNVTAGRCQEGSRSFGVSRNLLQVTLLDQPGDLLFSLAPSSHRNSLLCCLVLRAGTL
jgi:hypothetical protein